MQQQALELAETLVRDNEARVELGTMARIEVLGARSEAAARRQRLAEAQQALATAELALKQLIVGGTDDDYWTATLHPVDLPTQDVEPSEPEVAPQGLSPRIEAATAARELADGEGFFDCEGHVLKINSVPWYRVKRCALTTHWTFHVTQVIGRGEGESGGQIRGNESTVRAPTGRIDGDL